MPGDDVEIVGVFEATDLMTMLAFGPSVELLLPVMTGDTQGRSAPYAEIFFRAREGMDREAEEEVRRLLMSRLAQRGDDQRTMDGMSLEVLVTPVAAGAQLRQARLLSVAHPGRARFGRAGGVVHRRVYHDFGQFGAAHALHRPQPRAGRDEKPHSQGSGP